MYLLQFYYLFSSCFLVLLCSFLLFVSTIVVWWLFLGSMLGFLSFWLLCVYCRFLICVYHGVHTHLSINTSTCFKLVVNLVQTHSKRSTFFLLPSPTFCVLDILLIFYSFMLAHSLTIHFSYSCFYSFCIFYPTYPT